MTDKICTEEEIKAMSDADILAMDPEKIHCAAAADAAASVEDVVSVVDQRQTLVTQREDLLVRVSEIDAMVAEMDAAVVATVDSAMNAPATAETGMATADKVAARRKILIQAARRAAEDGGTEGVDGEAEEEEAAA